MAELEFYDVTLRDGAQSEGISFSEYDKKMIFGLLDRLGIDLIEGGDPASNPKDAEFFANTKSSKLVAFGSTRRKDTFVGQDAGIISLLEANTDTVCIYGKSCVSQVEGVLGATKDDNLNMIGESVAFLAGRGKRVIYDAEHFFDGYKENPQYAMQTLMTAFMSGADTLVLCDTRGATFPSEIFDVVKKCVDAFDGAKIGIHCHNDIGTAVANSLVAIEAGATHVQGTLLGFGERCGNANLSTIIADVALKLNKKTNVNLSKLTNVANAIAEICNIILDPSMPYVGSAAFSHKAGTHADAVMKEADSFEHVKPEEVGNMRHILVSEVSGRSVIVDKLKQYFPSITKTDPEVKKILDRVKELEKEGYQFEGADASFIIMAQKAMGTYVPSFSLEKYEINASSPDGKNSATVTLKVGNDIKSASADGNGPVNALDKALREVLSEFYPEINKVSLIDYKVRVIDSASATGAMVRVSITSRDGYRTWTTVGVSTDIIKASWKALVDSLEYRLSIKE